MTVHSIPPVYDAAAKILILGSFPSVKSREAGFFYGHPQNRFWSLLSRLLGEEEPRDIPAKKRLLLTHGVALWDVVSSCDIAGSADLSIRNARPNDLAPILAAAPIRRIFCNGKTAFALYKKLILPATGREAICLPSTSPANAACSRDALFEAWAVIKNDLEQRTNT